MSRPYSYDRELHVEQAVALMEVLGIARANIIDNSMGSVVAMGVAMQRPELLNKIVLKVEVREQSAFIRCVGVGS